MKRWLWVPVFATVAIAVVALPPVISNCDFESCYVPLNRQFRARLQMLQNANVAQSQCTTVVGPSAGVKIVHEFALVRTGNGSGMVAALDSRDLWTSDLKLRPVGLAGNQRVSFKVRCNTKELEVVDSRGVLIYRPQLGDGEEYGSVVFPSAGSEMHEGTAGVGFAAFAIERRREGVVVGTDFVTVVTD